MREDGGVANRLRLAIEPWVGKPGEGEISFPHMTTLGEVSRSAFAKTENDLQCMV